MKRQLIAGLLVTACASPIVNASMGDVYGNDVVVYDFDGLSEHTEVKLNFDLLIMGSWDGSTGEGVHTGPDTFGFRINGDEHSWTFRNVTPNSETNVDSSWVTGDFNNEDEWTGIDRKFVDYADGFTIAHTGNSVEVEFFGSGLQENADESWMVSNVSLTAVPVPTAVWLFGSGLLGLVGMRRKVS